MPERQVDSFRFMGRFMTKMSEQEFSQGSDQTQIPWTPATKPIAESRVALLTSIGISMKDDEPFDMDGERANPTWGDPSWRKLPANVTAADVHVNHLHVDTKYALQDVNTSLPVARLAELVAEGVVASSAATHYSIMGYQGRDSSELENKSAPEVAAAMQNEQVDLAVLAPA